VSAALAALWTDRGLAMDYAPLFDVLSLVALPGVIQPLAPSALEALRFDLLAAVPDGVSGRRLPGPRRGGGRGRRTSESRPRRSRPRTRPASLSTAFRGRRRSASSSTSQDRRARARGVRRRSSAASSPTGRTSKHPRGTVGARLLDPSGHKAYEGRYEVVGSTMRLLTRPTARRRRPTSARRPIMRTQVLREDVHLDLRHVRPASHAARG
jgi:hypothetical protein